MTTEFDKHLFTDTDFRAKMQDMLAMERKAFFDKPTESYTPTFYVWYWNYAKETVEVAVHAIASSFNEASEKYPLLEKLGKAFYDRQQVPLAAVLISEAWQSKQTPKTERMQPRDDPNPEEVLVAFGRIINTHKAIAAVMPIARVRGIMRPCADDWQWCEGGKTKSALLDTFFNAFIREAESRTGFVQTECIFVKMILQDRRFYVEKEYRPHAAGFRLPATGATGRFVEPPSRKDDEGQLAMAMAVDKKNGLIHMDFGKPVAWLSLPRNGALELASMLQFKAGQLT